MKLLQILALAAAFAGVMVSASCCTKQQPQPQATYLDPAK